MLGLARIDRNCCSSGYRAQPDVAGAGAGGESIDVKERSAEKSESVDVSVLGIKYAQENRNRIIYMISRYLDFILYVEYK
jgi:hypothetical protein